MRYKSPQLKYSEIIYWSINSIYFPEIYVAQFVINLFVTTCTVKLNVQEFNNLLSIYNINICMGRDYALSRFSSEIIHILGLP